MPRQPTKDAAGIMLRAGVVPIDGYPGAMKPWPSLCIECGAEVTPTLQNVKARGRGCKHCVGRAVWDAVVAANPSAARSNWVPSEERQACAR